MNYINEFGNIDVKLLPLSNDEFDRNIQDKIIKGEDLTFKEKLRLRDRAVTNLEEFQLLSDHIYRATDYKCLEDYVEKGYINDDKNKGRSELIHWYLGGTSIRYGKVIIEANALPDKITLTKNYGGLMSGNPYVRHVTSNQDDPIDLSDITRIFFLDCTGKKVLKVMDMNNIKDILLEIEEGKILYRVDCLENKKAIYKQFDEQEKLDKLKNELINIREELNKNNKKVL